ncbi:MAG: hypothetical protein HYY17_01280 [Planctomycetes bacterium]|nr:hypothetical protein [Planctomycetota bacterium]
MRHAWAAAFVLALAGRVLAQPSQEELIKKRDAKLAEEWLKSGGWITDYDKVREEAKKANKLIFAYFTRSYSP